MLFIEHGNRPEVLLDALAERWAASPPGPYEREYLLVPHPALARWLAEGLAWRLGICAGLTFLMPAEFVWQLVRAAVPDWPAEDSWQRQVLTLAVYAEIEAAVAAGGGGHVARSGGADAAATWAAAGTEAAGGFEADDGLAPLAAAAAPLDAAARLALARELAEVLDQYIVLRPDWIQQWSAGAAPHWQARLWQRLRRRLGDGHWVTAQQMLLQRCREEAPLPGLPRRVWVFGLGPLSPALLQLFHALSRRSDWYWYHFNPCAEYWGDIESRRQGARRALRGGVAGEPGNSLLASWGRELRDFFDALLEAGDVHEERFSPPPGNGLLAAVQRAVLELKELPDLGLPRALAAQDASLCVLACHGPVRELQAVRDQLLDAFATLPDLDPGEVLLLAPDPARYAPYLETVFSHGTPALPVSLPGRPLLTSHTARAFLQLLTLPQGRFEVSVLLDVLTAPAVSARLGLDEMPPGRLRQWLHEAAIRWGLDGEHQAALRLPAMHTHTWRWGLDRLLLGLALEGEAVFAGLQAVPVALSEAEWLGVLADGLQRLSALNDWLQQPHGAAEWSARLLAELEAWCAPLDEPFEAAAWAALRDACRDVERQARLAGLTEPFPAVLVTDWLQQALAVPGPAPPVAGIRFGSLAQYRGVPADVVAVLGLGDGQLPRSRRAPPFDWVAHGERRRGDRSSRDEDRALLLEALLLARRRLILSYPAFAQPDAAPLPPSALVEELLATLEEAFDPPAGFQPAAEPAQGSALRQWLWRLQPLQAFSPRLFDGRDERQRSFDAAACAAARARQRAATQDAPGTKTAFCSVPLPPPEAGPLLLEDWENSLLWPQRALLRRLRLQAAPGEMALPDHEPFLEADALQRWTLRRQCLAALQAGESEAALCARLRASGQLPLGESARAVFEQHWREAARQLCDFPVQRLPPVELALALEGWQIHGRLAGCSHDGLWLAEASRPHGGTLLRLWLRHLLLCRLRPAGVQTLRSHLLAAQEHVVLRPVAEPAGPLRQLLALHMDILRQPVPWWPKAGFAYAQALHQGRDEAAAMHAARREWQGHEQAPGEASRPESLYLWNDRDPLAEPAFARLAWAVFAPLLEHLD